MALRPCPVCARGNPEFGEVMETELRVAAPRAPWAELSVTRGIRNAFA